MKSTVSAFLLSLALMTSLMGCSSVELQEWPEQAVYTVIDDRGELLLVALDPASESALVVAALREIGANDASTVTLQNSSPTPLLAWTRDNESTHFAVVNDGNRKLEPLGIELDTGAYSLSDDSLIARLPKTSESTEIAVYSTTTGEEKELKLFSDFPTMFVRGEGPPTMVGNTQEGSVFLQPLAGKDPSIVAAGGVPGDAVQVGSGIAISISNPVAESAASLVPSEVVHVAADGTVSSFGGVEDPRLLSSFANYLAVDDTTNGQRMIRVLDITTMLEVYSVHLESHVGVQGLSNVGGKFVAVQDEKVTWIDPVEKSQNTSELPSRNISGL